MNLEGIVSKRRDLLYQSGRSKSWLKINPASPALLRLQEMVRGSEEPGLLHLLPLASILEPWRSAFREAPAWQPSPLTAHSPVRNFRIPSPFRLTCASLELPSSIFMRRFASSSKREFLGRGCELLPPTSRAATTHPSPSGPWYDTSFSVWPMPENSGTPARRIDLCGGPSRPRFYIAATILRQTCFWLSERSLEERDA
jgi:hypothetical protein